MTPSRIEEAYQGLILIAKYYKTHVREHPRHAKLAQGSCWATGSYDLKNKWHWQRSIDIQRFTEKDVNFLAIFAHELGHIIFRNKWPENEIDMRSKEYSTSPICKRHEEYTAWLYADGLAEKLGFYNKEYVARREESLRSYGIYTR